MKQLPCMWCQKPPTENNPFIKCHLIPEYFFRQVNKNSPNKPFVSINRNGEKPYEKVKRASNKGAYDSSIICASCEGLIFQPIDNIVINNFFQKRASWIDHQDFFTCSSFQAKDLYVFILSVLWRLDVSHEERAKMYKGQVSLGPYREKIQNEIVNASFCYDVCVMRISPSKNPSFIKNGIDESINLSISDPRRIKDEYNRKTIYMLTFAGFLFVIMLGKSNKADTIKLQNGNQIILPILPFDQSHLLFDLQEIAKKVNLEAYKI